LTCINELAIHIPHVAGAASAPTKEAKVALLIGFICFFGMSAIVVAGASFFSKNMA